MLQNRLQEAEASAEFDEAVKSNLIDLYRKSISLVEQRRSYEASTAEFAKARESAPKRSAALREALEELESKAAQKLPDSLARKALPVLEQQLLGEKADLSGLTTALAKLQALLETQSQRAQQARDRLTEAKKRQAEVADALQLPTPENQPQRLTEAQRWALELDARAFAAEIEMLEQELLSQPMRVELLGVQRDKATLELNRQLQYVELLGTLVAARRLREAESVREEAEETERQAFGKHELVQDFAQQNTLLGEELNALAEELERVTGQENATTAEAKRVADNFRLARQKLEIAGLSEALGQALLEQRRGLPDSADFQPAPYP
jgi:potassium efflux system protein